MERFLVPYIKVILGAAFSVQQTLEGLGLWTAWQPAPVPGATASTIWDLSAAIGLPLLVITVYLVALLALITWAAHCLRGWRGATAALAVIITPGLLSLAGVSTGNGWVPAYYEIGSGSLGSPWGMAALALLGLATGWVLTVISSKYLKLGDRYRNAYDHLWYSMAVVTGVLFVADTMSNSHHQHLEATNSDSKAASGYLLHQVRALDGECRVGMLRMPYICDWASKAQQRLVDYANMDSALYWRFGPKTSNDLYLPLDRRGELGYVDRLRRELLQLNDARCEVRKINDRVSALAPASGICEAPPDQFQIAFAEPFDGARDRSFDGGRTVAIANEAIVPSLIRMRELQERFAKDVKEAHSDRHFRWLFYVAFALLAGGKVGNATGRLVALPSPMPKGETTKIEPASHRRRVKVPDPLQERRQHAVLRPRARRLSRHRHS